MNPTSTQKNELNRTKIIALMTILAALYAVGSYLPGFPMLGVPGSKIDLVRALEISYGIVLGPMYGPITAFLGAIVGKTLTGGGVGLYFTPLAPITAFVAANMRIRGGWKNSAVIILTLIMVWYMSPMGRRAYLAPVLHVAGLIVVIALGERIFTYLNSKNRTKLYSGLFLAALPSTLAGHIAGNIIYLNLFSPAPEFFVAILPVSTAERLVIAVIATIIGAPIIYGVRLFYPELLE